MGEHTPTPWGLNPDDRPLMAWNVEIVEGDNPDMRIAFMANGQRSEANAAFIIKAVNNHDALVAQVEELKQKLEFAEFEWNRATLSWQEAERRLASVTASTPDLHGEGE